MFSLAQFSQRWLNHLEAFSKIEFSAVREKLVRWKLKIQNILRECLQNPAERIEALLYLELRFIAAMHISPLRVILQPCEASESWRQPRLTAREGFPLRLVIGIQALHLIRECLCVPIISYNLVVMRNGMLTPDALLFLIGLLMAGAGDLVNTVILIQRKEMAQMFNSCAVFNESYSRK